MVSRLVGWLRLVSRLVKVGIHKLYLVGWFVMFVGICEQNPKGDGF